jgi:chromosome segregation ATPase
MNTQEIIIALLSALGAIMVTKARSYSIKSRALRAEFDELMDANRKFREEIKKDLCLAKQELAEAKAQLKLANDRISILESELREKQAQVTELEAQVVKLRGDLMKFESRNK